MIDHDPVFLVVLVIHHCVNTTEANMETDCLVKEDGHVVWACSRRKCGVQN